MIIAEKENLTQVKVLVHNPDIELVLWEDSKGNMFVSATSSKPEGTVYFGTTPSLLCQFLESSVTLQTLFDLSPSVFVELNNNAHKVLYSRRDRHIELKCGEQTIKHLIGSSPVEVWKCVIRE